MRSVVAGLMFALTAAACSQSDNSQAQQFRKKGSIQFIYVLEKSAITLTDEWRGNCLVANKVRDGGRSIESTGCWDMNEQEDVVIIKWAGGVAEHLGWNNFKDYEDYLMNERYKRGWLD